MVTFLKNLGLKRLRFDFQKVVVVKRDMERFI